MGSLETENVLKSDLNDSGLGQDESMRKLGECGNKLNILDLPDDALLYILWYCEPRDLKSLAYTCLRFGALVSDRTLWERVDARSEPVGPKRMQWFMKHGLSPSTTELLLSGYAREAEGCLGHMNCKFKDVEKDADKKDKEVRRCPAGHLAYDPNARRGIIRGGPVLQIYETMPRATCFPLSDAFGPDIGPEWAPPENSCPGPQYTLTPSLLRELEAQCPAITSLGLEYCNIDCTKRNISNFPRTLKKLSLRGSKCYNQPLDKSILFKIQDYLTKLEELNVSECDWIEPSCLLPLSKLPSLLRLYMRRCPKMTECVAYSSLATRYGFKKLQVIDLRESPVGDSEVSSFGWVSTLEELYVSPAPDVPKVAQHAHYIGDVLPEYIELDPWEEEEPEYFKIKEQKKRDQAVESNDMECEASGSLKRKMDSPIVCSCGAKNAEVAAKKPKQTGVNEGASTSKWSPPEEAPPLRYMNGTYSEPNDQMESEETDSAQPTKSNTVESPETTKSSETAELSVSETAGATKSSETTESPGPESSITTNTSEPESSITTKTSEMDSSISTKTSEPESSITTKTPEPESSGTTKSPEPATSSVAKESPENPSDEPKTVTNADLPKPTTSQQPDSDKTDGQKHTRSRQNRNSSDDEGNEGRNQEPVHKVLYVNVGRRLHTMYRLTMPVYAFGGQDLGDNARRFDGPFANHRLDPRTLISDATVHRFGRSDTENVSYINIGPNGVQHDTPATRPDRSNLRVLSMTGFTNITNRSLVHLVTAAPMLRRVDFSGTRVNRQGAEDFRNIRPDCEVICEDVES